MHFCLPFLSCHEIEEKKYQALAQLGINIRSERRDINTESTDSKSIIKEYYEQLYAHRFDNVDEMNQFLE